MVRKVDKERNAEYVSVVLANVPSDCSDSKIHEPCASVDPNYPKLFTCAFTNSGAMANTTGVSANSTDLVNSAGRTLGTKVFVDCAFPSKQAISNLAPELSSGKDAELKLKLFYVVTLSSGETTETILGFEGAQGGDVITMIATSPPPPTPPATPPPPPPYTWEKPTGA
jgi:hypothetical protein